MVQRGTALYGIISNRNKGNQQAGKLGFKDYLKRLTLNSLVYSVLLI